MCRRAAKIIPDFSIRENILMGSFARADGKREIPPLVAELFPYLIDNLERNGGVLSGGQQQQLAIARALAPIRGSSCSTSRTKASSLDRRGDREDYVRLTASRAEP